MKRRIVAIVLLTVMIISVPVWKPLIKSGKIAGDRFTESVATLQSTDNFSRVRETIMEGSTSLYPNPNGYGNSAPSDYRIFGFKLSCIIILGLGAFVSLLSRTILYIHSRDGKKRNMCY